jgi:hypothetical protein
MGAYCGGDSIQVGIEEQAPQIPCGFSIFQNCPNPFNPSTTIKFNLPKASDVTIDIYDILGRKVETIVEHEQPAGIHQLVWNANGFSSGIYFYRIQAGKFVETRKMMLIK